MNSESPPSWPVVEPPPFLPAPRRRWPVALFVAILLALAGAGAGDVWLNPGLFIHSMGRGAGDADTSVGDKAVMTDLLAAQQRTADDLAAIQTAVADQQEQLKAIVGQLATLSSKLDALRTPQLAPAPSPGPTTTVPTASATPVAPVPAAHVAPRPKKPPRAPTQSGPISVGGAPLNTAPNGAMR